MQTVFELRHCVTRDIPRDGAEQPELVHGRIDGVHTHMRHELAFERSLAARVIEALSVDGSMRYAEFS